MSAELATYRAAIKRLASEVADLRNQLKAQEIGHQIELRTLRAQLNEGLTPELHALRKELHRWRDRAISAEGRLRARSLA